MMLRLHIAKVTKCVIITDHFLLCTVTISIIFQSSHLSSVNQIISWHSASMNDIIHYENDSYYLLKIDYNETGPLEIAVTFSSNVCSKTTVIQYNSESLVDIVMIKYV